jgi:tetratricopeptide (TPR) repeat protein
MKDQSKTRKRTAVITGAIVFFSLILAVLLFSYIISNPVNKIKKANVLLEAGDFLGARKIYDKVVEKEPKNFSAHYGLGMSWCAETIYKTELGLAKPQDWYTAIYHMTIAMNLKKNDQVQKTLAILHFNLGTCYKKMDDPGAALKLMEQAVEYDPTLLKALNLLGAMYHERGNFEKAEYYYLKTIEVKPDYAMAHFNLGALAWANDDYTSSKAYFQRAVSLAPENAYFQNWLSKAQEQTGDQ